MNKKELLEWAVRNIRKGNWPTLASGIKTPSPESAVWSFLGDPKAWVLQSGGAVVRADDWEAAKHSKQGAKQANYHASLEEKGKQQVTVISTIKRAHEIRELAVKHRAELEKEGVNNGN